MKKYLIYIASATLTLILSVGVFTFIAHADTSSAPGSTPGIIGSVTGLFGLDIYSFFGEGLALLANWAIAIMSFLVAIAGSLLNISINLTLHIKDFVISSPAIYNTWRAIRDVSGIFIIFFLLYAAIQLILGVGNPGFGALIKNIVMAGILINFSFFFAGLGIDASNIISLQLYNAIAPANNLNLGASDASIQSGVTSSLNDGGLSNIFMNSLQITAIYKGSLSGGGQQGTAGQVISGNSANLASVGAPIKILLGGVIGVIIEFTVALSFAVASFAFIARFVILIILLAFSPIWFASHIVPMTSEYAKKWITTYWNMLIFMPVYLLLMYLALNVLTTSPLFTSLNSATATAGSTAWYSGLLTLGINAAIVVFLLNAPLVAAASIAGTSIPILDKAAKNLGARKWFGKAGGFVGTRALGAPAGMLDKLLSNSRMGNSLLGRDIRSVTTGAIAGAKMGASRSFVERTKDQKDVDKKDAETRRQGQFETTLARTKAGKPLEKDASGNDITVGTRLGRMTEKERLGLNMKQLTNSNVVKNLKKSDFEAVLKADETDISEEDKRKIFAARKDTMLNAINTGDVKTVTSMAKNMDTDDFIKLATDGKLLDNDTFIESLSPNQLKDISEKGLLGDKEKRALGDKIFNWSHKGTGPAATGPQHRAYSYVDKNDKEWL